MDRLTEALVTIFAGVTGVAIVALLVSRKSNTAGVIQAGASGYSNALATALSPVTGSSTSIDLSYPSDGSLIMN
jgi:PRD1 phage membrane DNA delivery